MTAHTHIQPAECASSCRERKKRETLYFQELTWLVGRARQKARRFFHPQVSSSSSSSNLIRHSHEEASSSSFHYEKDTLFPHGLSLFYRQPTRLGCNKANRGTHTHTYIYTPRRKVSSGDRSSTLGRSSTLLPFRFRISLFFSPTLACIDSLTLLYGRGAVHFLSFSFLQSSPLHVRPNQPILAGLRWPMPIITHSVNFFFCWLVE